MAEELIKYFQQSESVEMMRSEIHPAPYNPRKIDEEGKRLLKRSIKNFGVLGGIVVNKQTGNTITGGHQKVFVLDEINKYDENTHENDYKLRVEVIDVDLPTEKTINTMLNNPRVGGTWDYDKLREIVIDIDYKNAGLTEEDLSIIGVDYLFRTEDEDKLSNELGDLMAELDEEHQQEVQQRKAEREAKKAAQQQMTFEEKTQHMKDVKQQVKEQAIERAANHEAYFMISFDNWKNKASFAERFGLDPNAKFIKGEDLLDKIEGYTDDFYDDDNDELPFPEAE